MIDTLVLSGGSIKGITYIGVLKALSEHPDIFKNIKTFAGTSIGSIFALYFTLGITYDELIKYLDIDWFEYLDLDIENLLDCYGLDNCEKYLKLIKKIMGVNADITFRDLYEKTHKRLIISATCMNNYKIEYFDYITHPNLKVIKAIQASICIPVLFIPVEIDNKRYIDGGIIEALPISIFNKKNTLGIWVVDKNHEYGYQDKIQNINMYMHNVILCFMKTIQNFYNFMEKYNILKIEIPDVNLLDFNLNVDKKKEMIKLGYDKMKNYIEKNINL